MEIGDSVHFVTSCAGERISFEEGQVIKVTETNFDQIESCLRAGYAEEVEVVVGNNLLSAIENQELVDFNIIGGQTQFVKRKIENKINPNTRIRVLVFCPTTPRVQTKTIEAILAQRGDVYFHLLFTRDNPYPKSLGTAYKNVQLNYDRMRELMKDGFYDKVWIIEEDMIPPDYALHHLLEVDAPIVSGLYALRHTKEPTPNLLKLGGHPEAVGSGYSWDELKPLWGETIEVSGACMGCLLIDKAFFQTDFRFMLENNNAPDMAFAQYCWSHKITQKARLDVICGHINRKNEILYPDYDTGWRIEGLAA